MSSRRTTPRPRRKPSSPRTKKPPIGSQSSSPPGRLQAKRKLDVGGSNFDREHAPYLHALLENNPLATVILDTNRLVRMCNPAFERLFGFSLTDMVGKDMDPLLATPSQPDEPARLGRLAQKGETVRAESKRRRKDGTLVDVRIIRAPL